LHKKNSRANVRKAAKQPRLDEAKQACRVFADEWKCVVSNTKHPLARDGYVFTFVKTILNAKTS
jgi:hypothetical protein